MTEKRLPVLVTRGIGEADIDVNILSATSFCEVDKDTMYACTLKMYTFFKTHPLSIHIFGNQIAAFDVFYNTQDQIERYSTFRYFYKVIMLLTKGAPDYYYQQLQIPDSIPNAAIHFMTQNPDSIYFNYNFRYSIYEKVRLSKYDGPNSSAISHYVNILLSHNDYVNILLGHNDEIPELEPYYFGLIISKILYLIKLGLLLPYRPITVNDLESMTVLIDYYMKIFQEKDQEELLYLYNPTVKAIEQYIQLSINHKRTHPKAFKRSLKFIKEAFKKYHTNYQRIQNIRYKLFTEERVRQPILWNILRNVYNAQKPYMTTTQELQTFFRKDTYRQYLNLLQVEEENQNISNASSNSDLMMDD